MIKPLYNKDPNSIERLIYNYDRRNYRSKQAQFERNNVISASKLGFNDIDDVVESVIDRVMNRVSSNSPHRPNLFDPNYKIGVIRHINE